MPEEIFVLFMLVVLSTFGLTMTSMILRHRRKQKAEKSSGADASMTTSELESMMRRAVEDATAPLVAKVEDLEMELVKYGADQKQLQAHDTGTRISLEEEEEILDVEPVAVPTKTRT